MNRKTCCLMGILMGGLVSEVGAVQVNQRGHGEVLIYPYYSVNNNLNTLYSVVNTTAETKAIKVNFLESDIGHVVLSFNVYLSAFDVWTGALVAADSTIGGHVGEASVMHVTSDTSCAPFLNKAGQEFLPFTVDADLLSVAAENTDMRRVTEGHFAVIEMATFDGATVAWADHGSVGVPRDCASIQADWNNDGIYDVGDESSPNGGLVGSASLVNVAEGIAFSYDAIALQNFWQGPGSHTEPGVLEPDLSSAFPESRVLLDSGDMAVATWEHGFQAVSEVLTHAKVMNEYALDQFIAGQTEWVLNFPTKGHHSTEAEVVPPFVSAWDGLYACESIEWGIWDREATFQQLPICTGSPCPPRPLFPNLCQSTNVMDFYLATGTTGSPSTILGSFNQLSVFIDAQGHTESGWIQLEFPETTATIPTSGDSLQGLPVTGFAVQQFTNAGAAQGLLAQYGALFKHKYIIEMSNGEEDEI